MNEEKMRWDALQQRKADATAEENEVFWDAVEEYRRGLSNDEMEEVYESIIGNLVGRLNQIDGSGTKYLKSCWEEWIG